MYKSPDDKLSFATLLDILLHPIYLRTDAIVGRPKSFGAFTPRDTPMQLR